VSLLKRKQKYIKKQIKKIYIHPKMREYICKYMVWKDEYGICYFSYKIYNTCNKCPFKYIKGD
jgi:transposase-like protein